GRRPHRARDGGAGEASRPRARRSETHVGEGNPAGPAGEEARGDDTPAHREVRARRPLSRAGPPAPVLIAAARYGLPPYARAAGNPGSHRVGSVGPSSVSATARQTA